MLFSLGDVGKNEADVGRFWGEMVSPGIILYETSPNIAFLFWEVFSEVLSVNLSKLKVNKS